MKKSEIRQKLRQIIREEIGNLSKTNIIKKAQSMDCASFYKKYERNLEMIDIENLMDFNEGTVNLLYRPTDAEPISILFINGKFAEWSY